MPTIRDDVVAVAVATIVSGAPSTVHAFATERDLLAATDAAGTLWPGRRDRPGLVAGALAHIAVSVFWGSVLRVALRRTRHPYALGVTGGAAIAALDLEVVAKARPALRALPRVPQWLDNVAFALLCTSIRSR